MMPVTKSIPVFPSAHCFSAERTDCSHLLNEWKKWAALALPGNGECRDIAFYRLKDCLARRSIWLDLSGLQLTVLPPLLPDFLEELHVNDNRLTQLPARLPVLLKVLDISNNHLFCLPKRLPAQLKLLDASKNCLTGLPALPDSLKELNVDNNQLRRLPAHLPVSLKTLEANYNQLIQLPVRLPAFLEGLYVSHNQLIFLSVSLPLSLINLDVSGNQLTSLPTNLPDSIDVLDASDNQLTRLPDQLPTLLELYVRNNQLTRLPETLPSSLKTLYVAHNPLRSLPNRLPESLISIDVNELVAACWHDSVAVFLAKIRCWDSQIAVVPWKKIHTENNACVFADFLYKLCQGKNRDSQSLRQRIVNWLAYLAIEDHTELRKQTFLLANEATESCVDRASFYFNHMHILMVEHQLLGSDAPLTQIVTMIRGNFRLQVLERVAAEKATLRRQALPNFAEDLEIYLAYQCKLQESLALPIYTTLVFEGIAAITDEELSQAREAVMTAEKTDFGRYWLTESALWTAKLEKWDAEKKALADSRYLEAISSPDFDKAVDKALCKKGIPIDDADAHRSLSRIMAAELFYQHRYQLTQECLAAHKALSLFACVSLPAPLHKQR